MNVIANKWNGHTHLCEFRNDHPAIDKILDRSPLRDVMDALVKEMSLEAALAGESGDYNRYNAIHEKFMEVVFAALVANGCNIIWENSL
jgi:hypothetical protein